MGTCRGSLYFEFNHKIGELMAEKYTEAQKKAIDTYRQKNKERTNYLAKRSTSKNFISKHATLEDLEELKQLIKERESILQ